MPDADGFYDYDDEYDEEYYDEEEYGREDNIFGYDAHSTTPEADQEYEQFAQDTQYWGRYDGYDYMLANQSPEPLLRPMVLSYMPHSKHQDDYFVDHRHSLSRREMAHALELDPHHFHKVVSEPVHHEHKYFSEGDYDYDLSDYSDSSDLEDDDDYYEGLIGYRHGYSDSDIGFSSDSNGISEYEYDFNDIQFKINDDVEFKLETDDNYDGRDVDVGIVMPKGSGSGKT